jgi:hypothetical protein
MAKPVIVSFQGEQSTFQLQKLERQKLYGSKRRIPIDAKGIPCNRAALTDDGAVLLLSGMTAQGWFDPDGAQVESSAIGARGPDGSALELVPSTLGVCQVLEGPIEATEVLDLAVSSAYRLEPETLADSLATSLAAGEAWRFPFNYRPDYRAETAFLVGNDDGIYALIGIPTEVRYLSLNAPPPLEADDEGADDLDFEML